MNQMRPAVKVRRLRKGKMLGIASLEFGNPERDGFRISGFKILIGDYDETGYVDEETGRYIWIAPPSYRDEIGGFKNIFRAAPHIWKEYSVAIAKEFMEGSA